VATRVLLLVAVLMLSLPSRAATTRNDDTCDVAVLPAATLLLPYFEVDFASGPPFEGRETTIFTVTNVTNLDRIARVTLWTDRSYPVYSFNLYLTGYDVQEIDLYDVIARGVIAPDAGTGTAVSKRGRYSDPNAGVDLDDCRLLPGVIDEAYAYAMQDAFTEGVLPEIGDAPSCQRIGNRHDNAIGYATIDVVASCTTLTPMDRDYWQKEIRFDNVLMGDYRQVHARERVSQAGPLVHIRAIPEGGTPVERRRHSSEWDAGFDRTFYRRFQAASSPKLDGRQPLPSSFAARWLATPDGGFETAMKVWREGVTGIDAECFDYGSEGTLDVAELVVFDENENAAAYRPGLRTDLAATSLTSVSQADIYPQLTNGAHAGWMYFNLDVSARDDFASQAWVISSMRALGRLTTDVEATALANGCAPPAAPTPMTSAPDPAPLAPRPSEESCDIATLPAATLLLPYFEVDTENGGGRNTLFTLTNAGPTDRIARVTLWTDYGFPVFQFNVFLTGYDVQSISLYDVFVSGWIAPVTGTGTQVTPRGPLSARNRSLDLSECERLAGPLDAALIPELQRAFLDGRVAPGVAPQGCTRIGGKHDNATGYATIDVVRNCDLHMPDTPEYWTDDIAFDNVLTGDYQQVDVDNATAEGLPLVHIRTVEHTEHTFYSQFQNPTTPRLDRRQPLPSVFAARWVQRHVGPASSRTSYRIWREIEFDVERCRGGEAQVEDIAEFVRFDEQESAVATRRYGCCVLPIYIRDELPVTSTTEVSDDDVFPQLDNGALGGWMYLNLDSRRHAPRASQSWVVVSMKEPGVYSVAYDAMPLGNGCSPPAPLSEVQPSAGDGTIGPLPDGNGQ
jgi:hypothetical protein